jgi:outer membrane protein assembly factor BamB
MRHVAATVAVSALLFAGGCGPAGDETFAPPVLEGTSLQYYWHLPVTLESGETVEKLHLLDNNLYLMTNRQRLIALDAKRGLTRWSYLVTDRLDEPVFRPWHTPAPVTIPVEFQDGRQEVTFNGVVLNTIERMILLDRDTGGEMRNRPLGHPANGGGASDGMNFYYGGVSGRYLCIGLRYGVTVWQKQTGSLITAPVVYDSDHLFVASEDHKFYCTKVAGLGEKIWTQQLGGSAVTEFHAGGRGCYVPCEDGRLYAFQPFSGERLWEPFICRKPLVDPPQVAQNMVFQYARGDTFYAIDIASGAMVWSKPEGRMVMGILGKDVYLLDADRDLQVVDIASGEVSERIPLRKLDLFLPNTTTEALYAATRDGHVYCLRRASSERMSLDVLREGLE